MNSYISRSSAILSPAPHHHIRSSASSGTSATMMRLHQVVTSVMPTPRITSALPTKRSQVPLSRSLPPSISLARSVSPPLSVSPALTLSLVTRRAATSASERRGNTLKGFTDFDLKARTRTWS